MTKILTIKKLKAMKPETIIGTGVGTIEHPWFNDAKKVLEKDGKSTMIRWVAIRGYIHDWAIYHSMDANICKEDFFDCSCHLLAPDLLITRSGAKLHNMEKVQEFVPCDKEALEMYRH